MITALVRGPTTGTQDQMIEVTIRREIMNINYRNVRGKGFTRSRKAWTMRLAVDSPALGKKAGEHLLISNIGKPLDWKTKDSVMAYIATEVGASSPLGSTLTAKPTTHNPQGTANHDDDNQF